MNIPPTSEGPEVAASEPSEPIAPQKNEQENTIMTQQSHNPFPVDPTGPLTIGRIPEGDLDRLFAATVPPIERLRQAVAEVDPADLTGADAREMVALIRAALDSDSQWADRMRAADARRAEQ